MNTKIIKEGKQLNKNQMKLLHGGNQKACSAKVNCPGGAGSISCSGVEGDANNGGCDVVVGNTFSAVSCRQADGTYVSQICRAEV